MKEKLQEIRARCDAAEPGPWAMDFNQNATVPYYRPAWRDGAFESGPNLAQAIANEQFIAHAREDIPALLAEVERLTKKLKNIGDTTAKMYDRIVLLETQLAAAVEELQTLDTDCQLCASNQDSEVCSNEKCETGELWTWRGAEQ